MKYQNATLRFGRRELIATLIGIVAYGGIAWLSNFSGLAGSLGVDIRPAVAIPVALGFIFGPIVGFLSGMFGNFLGDLLQGYIMIAGYPPADATGMVVRDVFAAYYLNWQIGNGLAGLIPGIMALYHRRYQSIGDMLQVVFYVAASAAVGMLFPVLVDLWVYPDFGLDSTFSAVFLPAFQHNLIVNLVLVPLLLYNWQRVEFGSTNWLESGLLRQLLTAVFLAAIIPTLLLGFFLSQQQRDDNGSGFAVQLGVTVAITLTYTVLNALGLAQTLSRPLLRLTESAKLMQQGKLSSERAQKLTESQGNDELGQLSRLFGTMAQEVIEREARLKQQVEALKIEIDHVKQSKQVEEITDNEFFRDLQLKARTLRGRDRNAPPADSSTEAEPTASPTTSESASTAI